MICDDMKLYIFTLYLLIPIPIILKVAQFDCDWQHVVSLCKIINL